MNVFHRWWTIIWLYLFSGAVVQYFGLFEKLWEADIIKLSYAIIAIFWVITGFIGYLTYRCSKDPKKSLEKLQSDKNFKLCVQFGNDLPYYGLIGTVIGFMIMFGDTFFSFDIKNEAEVLRVLQTLGYGVSTALSTTLVGMVCNRLIKFQLRNLEYDQQI